MRDWLWALTALLILAVILWFGGGCGMKREMAVTEQQVAERWYLPDIWNEARHPPTVDPSLYPPTWTVTPWPWPTKTLTATDTPKPTGTPTPTATPRPTKTRLPWPEAEVPSEVPYEVWLSVLEATRSTRGVEPWFEVLDDILVIMAGNNSYGAQISPIVEHETAEGIYRGMETCEGLLIETPSGHIWFLAGYSGPTQKVFPKTY